MERSGLVAKYLYFLTPFLAVLWVSVILLLLMVVYEIYVVSMIMINSYSNIGLVLVWIWGDRKRLSE